MHACLGLLRLNWPLVPLQKRGICLLDLGYSLIACHRDGCTIWEWRKRDPFKWIRQNWTSVAHNWECLCATVGLRIYGGMGTDKYRRSYNHIGQREQPKWARVSRLIIRHQLSSRLEVDRLVRGLVHEWSGRLRVKARVSLRLRMRLRLRHV